jgi:hypothetical protein
MNDSVYKWALGILITLLVFIGGVLAVELRNLNADLNAYYIRQAKTDQQVNDIINYQGLQDQIDSLKLTLKK